MTDNPSAAERTVRPVAQAAAILRHLGQSAEGAGVNAIARAVGIGPSSCFNVLRTLVAERLAGFDPVTKRYTLGLGTIDLARQALGGDAVVPAARAPMAALAERHDAAVGLWRLAAERSLLVALAESAAATRIHMVVGQRRPLFAGATGRATLAARHADDAEIAAAHGAVRWHNPPTLAAFAAEVHRAAEVGWAEDRGNSNHGIDTVAAAVGDTTGAPRFVLSASVFDGREDAAGLAAIGESIRDEARLLARRFFGIAAAE